MSLGARGTGPEKGEKSGILKSLYSDLLSQPKETHLRELCAMFLSWRKAKNRGKILVLPTVERFGGTCVQAPSQDFFLFVCFLVAPSLGCDMGDLLAVACGIQLPDQGLNPAWASALGA